MPPPPGRLTRSVAYACAFFSGNPSLNQLSSTSHSGQSSTGSSRIVWSPNDTISHSPYAVRRPRISRMGLDEAWRMRVHAYVCVRGRCELCMGGEQWLGAGTLRQRQTRGRRAAAAMALLRRPACCACVLDGRHALTFFSMAHTPTVMGASLPGRQLGACGGRCGGAGGFEPEDSLLRRPMLLDTGF